MTNMALEEEEQDRWHVQLANGVVCQMTLDLLDDAFQEGVVTEDTQVCQDGQNEWQRLGDLLGGGDDDASGGDDDASDVTEATAEIEYIEADDEPETTTYPASHEQGPASYGAVSHAPPSYSVPSQAPPPSYARPSQLPPASFAPPSANLVDNFGAAKATPDYAAAIYPVASREVAIVDAVQPLVGHNSTAPFATDIDDSDDAVPFRAKKRRGWIWIAAAAAIGGIGFGWTRYSAQADAAALTAALAAPPAAPEPPRAPPPPPVQPAPVVAAAMPAAGAPNDGRFNDDTKRALLEADKGHAAKKKVRVEQAQSHAQPHKSSADKVFKKGGSKYDPLNSSL